MKTIRATLTAIALLPASAALAHEGHHQGMSAPVGLRHMLTQPDHLAILALAFALVALSGWQVYRNRTPR
jgi:hydrogenase/urease accessory protein HupE